MIDVVKALCAIAGVEMSEVVRQPYILGLDIGVASIGWARIACDEDFTPRGLLGLGSHIFEPGTEGGEKGIAEGRDEARNKQRRDARLMRRQIWRRARRKRKLLCALIEHGLLPNPKTIQLKSGTDLRRPEVIHEYILALDTRFAAKWLAGKSHLDHQRLPYLMRAKAAVETLEREEVGRSLYHLAQRRGFLSNRRAEAKKKDEDASQMKKDIGELQARIDAHAVPTLGAYLASLNPDEQRLRGRWTSRAMYEREFDAIWAVQAKDHGLQEEARRSIRLEMFHQRPLKSQKQLIGHCSLIPTEKRCPIAHRRYQRFRVLQTINNLLIDPPGAALPRALTREERESILKALLRDGDLTFPAVRKLLQLEKGTAFNLERGDEKKLLGHRTDAKLRKAFGDSLDGFSESEKDRMVEDLRSFRISDALLRRASNRWRLGPDASSVFASLDLEEGYAPISLAAIERLLPQLEDGTPYATARLETFPESYSAGEPLSELPAVVGTRDELRNPAVVRALTEVRRLVNEAVRRHGKPAMVRVELARDVKNPRSVRERISRHNREREKERAAIATRIEKEAGITSPRRDDIERVILADECGWVCPYTGRQICWNTLLGRSPQFDVEHIWPKSRSLDDSLANKTLCHHEENRNRKRHHTPAEAYSDEELDDIAARIARWKTDPFTKAAKLARFREKDASKLDEFTNRHLSDTRFIARAAADYLGQLYGGRDDSAGTKRVRVCTGGLTAWLRSGWALSSILGDTGEKNRADHRHHAVDAVVVALSDGRAVSSLARAASQADKFGKRRAFEGIDAPWRTLREDVVAAVERAVVSHRQSRKVSGPLHDQSIYSKPINGSHRISKELSKLSPNEIVKGKIVDKRALAAIRSRLVELGKSEPSPQDISKIFSNPANAPLVRGHDGAMVRLRRVRIEADAGRPIGSGSTCRWIQPANNHHTVITAILDAQGNVRGWDDAPVALLDAYTRRAQKSPIVDRQVGDGRRFVFSLAPGEFVEMDSPTDATRRAIYRVASISKGDMELKLHTDARTADELKKAKARVRVSGEKLRKLRARKVRITYLGEVRSAGG